MKLLFPKDKLQFNLPNADIEYYPNFFESNRANELFEKLKNEIPWQQDDIFASVYQVK